MATRSNRIYIPKRGKEQVDLTYFNYEINYRDSFFTIFLPCAREKPYRFSTTHSYINKKIEEYIPVIWRKLIKICTISEVLGIIPEGLEDEIFNENKEEFYYEHYPNNKESDVERTSRWLSDYVLEYGTYFNFGYCTSKIFREICTLANLKCYPTEFKPSSALFEFRKIVNVKQLTGVIINNYKRILATRFDKWKKKKSHAYKVLEYALHSNPFTIDNFKKEFKYLRSPAKNVKTFCYESKSDKGVFFYYNVIKKNYHFPDFIKNLLNW